MPPGAKAALMAQGGHVASVAPGQGVRWGRKKGVGSPAARAPELIQAANRAGWRRSSSSRYPRRCSANSASASSSVACTSRAELRRQAQHSSSSEHPTGRAVSVALVACRVGFCDVATRGPPRARATDSTVVLRARCWAVPWKRIAAPATSRARATHPPGPRKASAPSTHSAASTAPTTSAALTLSAAALRPGSERPELDLEPAQTNLPARGGPDRGALPGEPAPQPVFAPVTPTSGDGKARPRGCPQDWQRGSRHRVEKSPRCFDTAVLARQEVLIGDGPRRRWVVRRIVCCLVRPVHWAGH